MRNLSSRTLLQSAILANTHTGLSLLFPFDSIFTVAHFREWCEVEEDDSTMIPYEHSFSSMESNEGSHQANKRHCNATIFLSFLIRWSCNISARCGVIKEYQRKTLQTNVPWKHVSGSPRIWKNCIGIWSKPLDCVFSKRSYLVCDRCFSNLTERHFVRHT